MKKITATFETYPVSFVRLYVVAVSKESLDVRDKKGDMKGTLARRPLE
jgi:hypothetical protein